MNLLCCNRSEQQKVEPGGGFSVWTLATNAALPWVYAMSANVVMLTKDGFVLPVSGKPGTRGDAMFVASRS